MISWNSCPKCKSYNINAGHIENDGDDAWCTVRCDNCGFDWDDIYQYSHSENPVTHAELNENGDDIP